MTAGARVDPVRGAPARTLAVEVALVVGLAVHLALRDGTWADLGLTGRR